MKKSIFIICALLLFNLSSFAQMTITPYGRADLSHFATPFNAEMQPQGYAYRKQTQPKLAYTTGIAVDYAFNEKWALKTGVEFQEMGDKRISTTFFEPGPVYEPLDKIVTIQSHQFINIPIQMQYHFTNDKKATPFIAIGTSVNWNIRNQVSSQGFYQNELVSNGTYNRRDNENFKPQKINFAINLDAGFKRPLTEKLTLNTFLSGNMLLLPTMKSDDYNSRHFNIGVGLGVGYAI